MPDAEAVRVDHGIPARLAVRRGAFARSPVGVVDADVQQVVELRHLSLLPGYSRVNASSSPLPDDLFRSGGEGLVPGAFAGSFCQ